MPQQPQQPQQPPKHVLAHTVSEVEKFVGNPVILGGKIVQEEVKDTEIYEEKVEKLEEVIREDNESCEEPLLKKPK